MAKTSYEKVISGGWLSGYKTYVTAVIGILTAFGAYMTGDMTLADLFQTVFPLAGLIFLRKGIETETNK